MIRRLLLSITVSALVIGLVAPSSASAQQTINFFVGGFVPRSLEARGPDDVLVRDFYLSRNPSGFLIFDVKDFRGFTGGAEYLVGLGDFFDAGLGVGFYSRTSPAIDADFTRPGGA